MKTRHQKTTDGKVFALDYGRLMGDPIYSQGKRKCCNTRRYLTRRCAFALMTITQAQNNTHVDLMQMLLAYGLQPVVILPDRNVTIRNSRRRL